MKLIKILTIVLTTTLIIGGIPTANAQTISIIPEPYQMTKGIGTYTLQNLLLLMRQVRLTRFPMSWQGN